MKKIIKMSVAMAGVAAIGALAYLGLKSVMEKCDCCNCDKDLCDCECHKEKCECCECETDACECGCECECHDAKEVEAEAAEAPVSEEIVEEVNEPVAEEKVAAEPVEASEGPVEVAKE